MLRWRVMLKRRLSLILTLLSISPIVVTHAYAAADKGQKQPASKTKQKISRLGVDTLVIVKLDDGRKLSGRIGEIGEDNFVLLAPVKGDRTARQTNRIVITYSEVKQVKYDGPAGGANLGPGFLVAGVVILLIALIR
jgi:hypothetical protein